MSVDRKLLFKIVIFLIIICSMLLLLWQIDNVQKMIYPLKYESQVFQYASLYELEPALVFSVIWVESKFDTNATSSAEACGLMQVTKSTGKWAAEQMGIESFVVEDLYLPKININIGCWYLGSMIDKFNGDINLALAAYNAGIGNVKKWLSNTEYSINGKTLDYIPFDETREYIKRVSKAYERYKKLYEF